MTRLSVDTLLRFTRIQLPAVSVVVHPVNVVSVSPIAEESVGRSDAVIVLPTFGGVLVLNAATQISTTALPLTLPLERRRIDSAD